MTSVPFKKINSVDEVSMVPKGRAVDEDHVNGSVVKPNVSLFHRLPKIARNEPNRPGVTLETMDDNIIDHVGGTSYEDGLRDGEKKASLVYLDTIKLLETSLQTLNDQYQLIRSDVETSHFKAVATTLKALMPQLAEHSAAHQIQTLVKDLCAMSADINIRIYVNPAQLDHLKSLIDNQGESENRLETVPDHQIEPGNVRCDWDGGGVEIDTTSVVQQSLAILDQALADTRKHEGLENGKSCKETP